MYAPIRYLCAGTFSSDSPSYSQPLSAKSLNGAGTAYSSPFTVNLKPKTALSSAVDESDLLNHCRMMPAWSMIKQPQKELIFFLICSLYFSSFLIF